MLIASIAGTASLMATEAFSERTKAGRRVLRVGPVMRSLGLAIAKMELPAIEKLAIEQKSDPFHVLIATLLSAQTKDAVTHAASVRLFRRAPNPQTMARLRLATIEKLIFPVSFYRNKARHVKETCRQLLDRFDGRVPKTMTDLLLLPGVGRKTANLTLIVAHRSSSNICVDTHVHRISNRLGWVDTRTPEETESALYKLVARRWWPLINLYLVTWGQNVCRPIYPRCHDCLVENLCQRIGVTRVGKSKP